MVAIACGPKFMEREWSFGMSICADAIKTIGVQDDEEESRQAYESHGHKRERHSCLVSCDADWSLKERRMLENC